MAQTLESLRNQIVTSIHGRRLGLDQHDNLIGVNALAGVVQDFTSTSSATAANYHGITRAMCTGSSQTANYSLASPTRPGITKVLHQHTTSTGCQIFTAANGNTIFAASGSSVAVVNLQGAGARCVMISLSTTAWAVLSGTTIALTNVTHTTST